jgi:hypothetical protein
MLQYPNSYETKSIILKSYPFYIPVPVIKPSKLILILEKKSNTRSDPDPDLKEIVLDPPLCSLEQINKYNK